MVANRRFSTEHYSQLWFLDTAKDFVVYTTMHQFTVLFFFLRVVSNFNTLMTPDTFSDMLGYISVSIIHRTLTWTTGCLTCICDLFEYVYTLGTSDYSLIRRTFVESAVFL